MTSTDHRVILLGDSTLDNVVWVQHEEGSLCVADHLKEALQQHTSTSRYEIVNWAADGFTSEEVLRGGDANISRAARESFGDPFPTPNPFAPLALLEGGRGGGGDAAAAATSVLSVGGNDIRHILRDMSSLPSVIATFAANYAEILPRVASATKDGRVVIVMQYRPALDDDDVYGVYAAMSTLPGSGSALEKLHALMEHIYVPVLELARRYGLPVVDLPNTLDPSTRADFKCQIEPTQHGFAPSLEGRVVVCGLPGVYEKLCGSRFEREVAPGSALANLGYSAEMVIKL